MLPTDPDAIAEAAPDAVADAAPATEAGDLPPATLVMPPNGERRRGWPFAVSMVLVAILGGGALFMSGYSIGAGQGRAPDGAPSEAAAWQPFWDVYDAVTNRFPLEKVPRTTLIEGAIRGLVESVGDPYSSYLSPEDFKGTLDDISGTFEGIGAEIGSVDASGNTSDCTPFGPDCHLVVITPIEGSPSESAGLKPGDVILKIDGSTLDGLTADQARDRVRGKAGTDVVLHIQRFTAALTATPAPSPVPTTGPRVLLKEFDVTITRAKIQRREVTSRVLAGDTVGYVHLAGFSGTGAGEMKKAIQAFLDKGIKKIVFDLRGNPGGFLLDALDVSSQFIATGPVYWTQDAQGRQTETDARPDGIATDPSIKVVVLIDGGSASASEIVAGALQDRHRAQLIGETSFGKGTVQEWIDLGELGGVKLTVNKWLTPDKRWIHHVGLTPDIAVTLPDNLPPGSDPVLDEALFVLGATAVLPTQLMAA